MYIQSDRTKHFELYDLAISKSSRRFYGNDESFISYDNLKNTLLKDNYINIEEVGLSL